jgi:phosphoglycolate phosphatase-like HAD superfamily hydrolase
VSAVPAFPKAVILDFDGVILESAEIKTRAFAELFKNFPNQLNRILTHHRKNAGVSRFRKFDYIYRHILKRPLPPSVRRDLGRRFSRLVVRRVLRAPFVPGAQDFLRKHEKDCRLFVVSGTPQSELRRIVRQRGLRRYFRGVYGSPRTKEQAVENILRRYRFSKRDVVMVGDAETDRRAAARGGIGFWGRVRKGERSGFPRSTPIVRDLRELDRRLRGRT